MAASAGAGGLGAPRLIERFGAPRVATTCLLGTAACFAALAQVEGLAGVLAVFAVAGFTFAGAFVPLGGFGLAGVREKGLASGLFQTSTHLGGAIALALLATVAAAGGFGAGCLAAAGLTLLGACAAGVLLVR